MKPIYLDYNATTPIAPPVAQAIQPYIEEHFGNPSSSHAYGQQTRQAIDQARRQIADLLGCRSRELVFTSGGSEANNHAISGAAYARQKQGRHIITSAIEHPAVTEVCRHLERRGFRLTTLPVDSTGRVSVDSLRQALTDDTVLVTIMHANNEVGTVQPIAELAAAAQDCGALFHTDAAQSVGKVPVNVAELGVDLLSVAGHKLYAPKGVGALYIRSGVTIEKLIHGADHENNRRAGTENVIEIVGLGAAAELVSKGLNEQAAHLRRMRDRLRQRLTATFSDAHINGHPEYCLPNTLSISIPGIVGGQLVEAIQDRVAASAGAACHSEAVKISTVLKAMKVPTQVALGTLRLSTGRTTTAEQIDRAVEIIVEQAGRLGDG